MPRSITTTFNGIAYRAEFAFALVHIAVDPGDITKGFTNISLEIAIQPEPGQTLDSLREYALAQAKRYIDTTALLAD